MFKVTISHFSNNSYRKNLRPLKVIISLKNHYLQNHSIHLNKTWKQNPKTKHSRLIEITLHHYRWRASNVDMCSALMANVQCGFFNEPHLLWHGASFYNGHLRGSVTLLSVAERLAVDQLFNDLSLSRLGFKHPSGKFKRM